MVRVLVIGGLSLLGQYVVQQAVKGGHDVWCTQRSGHPRAQEVQALTADLTEADSLRRAFDAAQPEYVILCAALTDVDYCEEDPRTAELINVEGPREVARLGRQRNARLLHVSTDYVFDGRRGPYDESSEARPLSVYGMTKWEGEKAVLQTLPHSAVVRMCALYGWNRDRGKANSVTWIINRLREGKTVPLFEDQRVSPTYAHHAASMLLELAATSETGIFHLAPPDCVTRMELGEHVCRAFHLPCDLLQPRPMAEARLKARRPLHSCLTSRRIEETLNRSVPPLGEALSHMRDAE